MQTLTRNFCWAECLPRQTFLLPDSGLAINLLYQPGRTYTSKYRGVHQTFPTRRWEAQFRRNGKPTSLGCFDHEEEAARAYDKMMIWSVTQCCSNPFVRHVLLCLDLISMYANHVRCELHHSSSIKGGITNFDISAYEADVPILQRMEQDELVMMLRRDGRTQAAQGCITNKALNLRTREMSSHQPSSDSGTQSEGDAIDSAKSVLQW